MPLTRRQLLLALPAAFSARIFAAQPASGPLLRRDIALDAAEVLDLWPGRAPGAPTVLPTETVVERSKDPSLKDRHIAGVNRPRLAVFRAANPNGASLLLMPGGGYRWVVVDREGYEMARWLSARGVTVFVLFYRLPGDGWADNANVALADAQRAMRLVRHHAASFAIDPARIAAMGFSAGGHLCADLMTRFDAKVYAPVDAADALTARPALAAPLYPVVSMSLPHAHRGSRERLLGPAPTEAQERAHSPHLNVSAANPPCFLLHAEDDTSVPAANSMLLRDALLKHQLPVETHLFPTGGHGFGLSKTVGKTVAIWPELFLNWATSHGWAGR
ncbi:MAG: alpha/beta hydrolase [Burkholderiales bacterium]|nr:alpha/beta hydrolase [Burkholderiales bacterium]